MNQKTLKIIQLNVDNSQEETEDAVRYAEENKYDLIAMQEPYVYFDRGLGEFKLTIPLSYQVVIWKSNNPDERPKAAIIVLNRNLDVKTDTSTLNQHFATAVVQSELLLISAYMNKNLRKELSDAENKAELIDGLLLKDPAHLDRITAMTNLPFIVGANAFQNYF